MKLWVFGDSYSIDHYKSPGVSNWQPIDKSWVDLTSDYLRADETTITAQPGVSNSWIYQEVLKVIESFTSNDLVIIQLTSKTREWLIERHPALSNWQGLYDFKDTDITKDEELALKYYQRYLHNHNTINSHYDMLVRALMFIAKNTESKMLFLPGFDPLPGCTGTLGDICYGEFNESINHNIYYKHHHHDPRVNHMHEVNHKILASKICNFSQNHECVNLLTGFERGFINMNNYKEIKQIA